MADPYLAGIIIKKGSTVLVIDRHGNKRPFDSLEAAAKGLRGGR